MPRAALLSVALAGVLVAGLAACDSAPGLPADVRRPSVTAFRLTPTTDSLTSSAATARIPLVLEATLAGEGQIVVRVIVRYAETDTLVSETRVETEAGPLRLEIPVVFPRGATGSYAVTLATEGADGREGDGAEAVFRFRAASLGPPVVTRVEIPATVSRPPSGSRPRALPIVATVTDPDGRENLTIVVLADADGNILGRLFDDGPAGGATDATADDGRYSAALQIYPADDSRALAAGTYNLFVVAFDRAGTQSAAAPFRFVIQ